MILFHKLNFEKSELTLKMIANFKRVNTWKKEVSLYKSYIDKNPRNELEKRCYI